MNSTWESRFYPNYTQFSEEELLKYDVVISLRIHMSYDEEFGEFLEHHYVKVQTADQNGIEIWEKADSEL